MSSTIRPYGTGGEIPIELFRQIIAEELVLLAGDPTRLAGALEREDVDAPQNSVDQFHEDSRRRIHEIIDIGGVGVSLQYPQNEEAIEHGVISVVYMDDNEDRSAATAGDVVNRRSEVVGTPDPSDWTTSRCYRLETKGSYFSARIEVGCWALGTSDPFLLYRLMKQVMLAAKGRFTEAGFVDYTISGTGFDPAARTGGNWPHVAAVPALNLQLTYLYRFDEKIGPVPSHIAFTMVGVN